MDKVVVVLGESISDDQYKILGRYIRFRLRRPFVVMIVGLETEAQRTFKSIREEAPDMIVFVVEAYQNLLLTEQFIRFEADPQFASTDVVTIYLEQLDRVDCSKGTNYVEQRLPVEPIRHPPPEIPKRFERKVDEMLAEYCERNIPPESLN